MSLIFSIYNALIFEGGNAIPESVPIPKQDIRKFIKKAIQDVVEPVFSKHGFDTSFILLGSTGQKEFSNDIDIAIAVPKESDIYQMLNELSQFAEAKHIHVFKSLPNNIISVGTTIESRTAQIDIILYAKNNSSIVKNIMQIDLDKTKFKNVHRILLLQSIAHTISKTKVNAQGIFSRYSLLNLKGLYRSTYKTLGQHGQPLKHPTKVSTERITSNWKNIIKILLGSEAKAKDVESVESLYKFIHSPLFEFKSKLPEIKDRFKELLDKSNIPMPNLEASK